ncbi:MAG TPA: hypothetical protein VHZ32_15250 [Rhizomicrobium sp.]|jgi:hypothetical protein|nr:hypothetical protein [Rhizomicrobium sp.]
MAIFLNAAWGLVTVFKYASVIAALTGVGIFGFYFVRENARSAREGANAIPASAWRGTGPQLGVRLVLAGIVLQLLSIIIAVTVPGRP